METTNDRYVRVSVTSMFYGLMVIALLATLYYIRNLVFVFLTAVVISSFVESGVRRLRMMGMGRSLSVVSIYVLILGILGSLLYLFVPVFASQIGQLSTFLGTQVTEQSLTVVDDVTTGRIYAFLLHFKTVAESASGNVLEFAVSVVGGMFNFLVLLILSFYLSMNERAIENFLRIVTPKEQTERLVGLWKRTQYKIGLWFQGQLLLGLIVGVLIYISLLFIGVKYSLLLALLAALMELVPFGIIFAAVPAVALGFVGQGSTGALMVAGVYLIVHELELNVISPLVTEKMIGVSSFVVVLSILVGLELAGFWGMVLGVPFAVLLTEIIDEVKERKGLMDTKA